MSIAPDMRAEEEAELRRRVHDAEETLRAIREGEVDAIVMRGGESDEVFSLASGRESYRALMEAMDIGAAALDSDGQVLYANTALCDLLESTVADLQANGLMPALGASASLIEALIARSSEAKQSAQIVLPMGETHRHLVVTAVPLPLEFSHGRAVTFADITDRVEADAAEESERIGQAIMASANEAVIVCDRDGVITHATAPVRELCGCEPVGHRFVEVFTLSFPMASGIGDGDDLVALALAGHRANGIEANSGGDAPRDWLMSAAPLRLAGDSIGGCMITMVDLSSRKELEKRQGFLMNELNHRVKNTLALVSAISARTIATAANLEDFGDRFSRRIEALAATHNLLVDEAWEGLNLHQLFEAELAPYISALSERVTLGKLDISVPARTAIALGLVIHELVTNAVKYGALSNSDGRIVIDAAKQPDGALEIVWREEGGPEVVAPSKTGFGQTLIARSLGTSDGAGTTVEFLPEGLVCTMRVPAVNLSE